MLNGTYGSGSTTVRFQFRSVWTKNWTSLRRDIFFSQFFRTKKRPISTHLWGCGLSEFVIFSSWLVGFSLGFPAFLRRLSIIARWSGIEVRPNHYCDVPDAMFDCDALQAWFTNRVPDSGRQRRSKSNKIRSALWKVKLSNLIKWHLACTLTCSHRFCCRRSLRPTLSVNPAQCPPPSHILVMAAYLRSPLNNASNLKSNTVRSHCTTLYYH